MVVVICIKINGNHMIGILEEKNHHRFFCGLSLVLNIPSFAIYLSGPCSTSKNIVIAINFADRDGMILELINNEPGCCQQNYFDCSWISNYSEENERLFMFTKKR
eukprot:110473_1